jgi:hypothetical protein
MREAAPFQNSAFAQKKKPLQKDEGESRKLHKDISGPHGATIRI